MNREGALLLHILQSSYAERKQEIDTILRETIAWETFLSLSHTHGLSPVVFAILKEANLENVIPPEPLERLRKAYYAVLAKNVTLSNRLEIILEKLKNKGVGIILLKGAFLNRFVYRIPFTRSMSDIDILIHEKDRQSVRDAMADAGFKVYETTQTCERYIPVELSLSHDITITEMFEIHSSLSVPLRLNYSFQIPPAYFWNGSEQYRIADHTIWGLRPTELTFYLAVHMSHHYYSRLIWLWDIVEVYHRFDGRIEWAKIIRDSQQYKLKTPVYLSLSIASRLFGVPIAHDVFKSTRPYYAKKFILEQMFSPQTIIRGTSLTGFTAMIATFLFIDRASDALKWYCFPSREWLIQRYHIKNPDKHIWIWYVLHLVFIPFTILRKICCRQ